MALSPDHPNRSETDDYDSRVEELGYRAQEVVFGLAYAFLSPGESVLDIGIGTGLSSILFHKAGLRIYGMDLSVEMLDLCRKKKFAVELKEHDLTVAPYPYTDASMDHAVCVSVLLHFKDLVTPFHEAGRIVRDGGLFLFMVADRAKGQSAVLMDIHRDDPSHPKAVIHRYDPVQINRLLHSHDFEPVRDLIFLAPLGYDPANTFRARAYVARRKKRLGCPVQIR